MGSSRALHLVEDLRGLLETMETEERKNLRSQIPDSTAEMLIEWLQSQMDHKLEKKKKRSARVGIASWIRCRRTNQKDSQESSPSQLLTSAPESKKISRGSMKLFGRFRRSQSTTFNPDDMSETEIKRGRTRATAGPRLGWSRDLEQSNSDLDTPFAEWTKEQVCNWLVEQGLGSYLKKSSKHWITSGNTLLQACEEDLKKKLGIKRSLHRKKLKLALKELGSQEETNQGKLDFNWVTGWLDDIGLPQYKTRFDKGRVDGRMLHYMTIDDLLSLKVVSVLHHISIKRAIQVLRINKFDPNCLRRRPSDENGTSPSEVQQWTNHQVMEWLCSVNLAEYAPNLRGSGVHGGLMVLEPGFNAETMAQLLKIPPKKTILKNYLATHFNHLIGAEAQRQKCDAMELPESVLLTATAKVKEDGDEYVCPMELGQAPAFKPELNVNLNEEYDMDQIEQMEDSEETVRQIRAFTEGINNLTRMINEDDMFKDFAARSPSAIITDEDSKHLTTSPGWPPPLASFHSVSETQRIQQAADYTLFGVPASAPLAVGLESRRLCPF